MDKNLSSFVQTIKNELVKIKTIYIFILGTILFITTAILVTGSYFFPAQKQQSLQQTPLEQDVRERAPATYAECITSEVTYLPNEPTPLECHFVVSEKDTHVFTACKARGGLVTQLYVDFQGESSLSACELRYYNPDYEFPKSFEECRDAEPEERIRKSLDSQGRCNITIESGIWGITNRDVATQLLHQCIIVGGSYVEYANPRFTKTKCVAWYEKGEGL